VYTSPAGSGEVSLTSGDTGIDGVAGSTPPSELGDGFTEGLADFEGCAVGF
jgi:hypothetical protein